MKDELVEFEVAKLAKEKGFNEETDYNYSSTGNLISGTGRWKNSDWAVNISAPTQSLLQRWLREVHKIDIYVIGYGFGYYSQLNNVPPACQGNVKYVDRRWNMPPEEKNSEYRTYEHALGRGLIEALKLI